MTSGGLTMEEAMKLQTFNPRKACSPARVKAYQGKRYPRCGCPACLMKWLEVNP